VHFFFRIELPLFKDLTHARISVASSTPRSRPPGRADTFWPGRAGATLRRLDTSPHSLSRQTPSTRTVAWRRGPIPRTRRPHRERSPPLPRTSTHGADLSLPRCSRPIHRRTALP